MRIANQTISIHHSELVALDQGRLRIPSQLVANGRTRWEMDLPDGSKVIIREEAHGLGPNVP